MPRSATSLNLQSWVGLTALGAIGLAALGWLLIGLPVSSPRALSALEAAPWPNLRTGPAVPGVRITTEPAHALLFATSLGPNPTPEVQLALHGIARGPRDQAALLAIGDAPPGWLGVGQSRDGVTLIDLTASKATLDTALGFREVTLDKPNLARPLAGGSHP